MFIYNLFPHLAGPFERWPPILERAAAMGFGWIYVNPLEAPGFSGSLYSIKHHDRINPAFGDETALREILQIAHGLGLQMMMDLVINHTAIDCPLIAQRPAWYVRDARGEVLRPSCVDPDDPSQITVWGDLAEIDNAGAPEGLWDYWAERVAASLALGWDGFRCDAAYKVPAALWRHLVAVGRSAQRPPVWLAETLGCQPEEVEALAGAGFDELFNGAKWWQYDQPWCLEQHERFGQIAPSVAFPESHDTERLMAEVGGRLHVVQQRYAFVAAFSASVMVPLGFECGTTRPMDVCGGAPLEEPPRGELVDFITRVNGHVAADPVWSVEGRLVAHGGLDRPTLVLEKRAGEARRLLVINKDWERPQRVELPETAARAWRPFSDRTSASTQHLHLAPAEVVYVDLKS